MTTKTDKEKDFKIAGLEKVLRDTQRELEAQVETDAIIIDKLQAENRDLLRRNAELNRVIDEISKASGAVRMELTLQETRWQKLKGQFRKCGCHECMCELRNMQELEKEMKK